MADVIAILLFVAHVKPHNLHVTAFEDGRCYCQVTDGIATAGWVTGRCYYHVGRWYRHRSIILFYFKFQGVEQNLIPNM